MDTAGHVSLDKQLIVISEENYLTPGPVLDLQLGHVEGTGDLQLSWTPAFSALDGYEVYEGLLAGSFADHSCLGSPIPDLSVSGSNAMMRSKTPELR